jgi:hypothetical protein
MYKEFAKVKKSKVCEETIYFMVDTTDPNKYYVETRGKLPWRIPFEDYNKNPDVVVKNILYTLHNTQERIREDAIKEAFS